MGTDKVAFVEVVRGGATGSGPDRKWSSLHDR